MQDGVLEGLQLEISERPTTKQLEDLRKQVKILQVIIVIKSDGHSLNQHYIAQYFCRYSTSCQACTYT